jgi:hypothetical protein
LVCRKIYFQDLTRDTMPEDVIEDYYTDEEPHRMFIAEVIEMIGQ